MDETTTHGMVITDNNAFLMAMGDGSRIEIHAADAAKDSWTQISQTAQSGDTSITLADVTDWQVGDTIAIAATGFDMDEAEERTITAISADGKTITFDQPLEHSHFGEIETHDNGKRGDEFQSWEMDMRAEVALLSRNVTIQGDADSAEDGYGGHTMVMNGAEMHIDGVEFTQMGQEGVLGRYALHWHMLGDATGQYISNSSIHETYNKGITIHGTQNTWVEDNVVYDTIGHSYYFEDGSEFGNVLMNNLGMNTNAADSLENAPIGSDFTEPSTYWVTNPDNHLIGNTAAGSDGAGFWFLSQEHVEGLSSEVGLYDDYIPRAQNPGQWVGNTSHSNEGDGIFIGRQFDESDGSAAGDPGLQNPFALTDFTTYKNAKFGIWMRNANGDFSDLKIAESNVGIQMWGSSTVEDSLILGSTSNFDTRPGGEHAGWQIYDEASSLENVHFDGFDGEGDAAIANGWGFGRSAINTAEGLTFGDDVAAGNAYNAMLTISGSGFGDRGGVVAGALRDIDGSISGNVGAVLTTGVVDENPGEHIEVETYAFEGIAGSGFNATDGAVWNAESRIWVHSPDSIIGKMSLTQQKANGNGGYQRVEEAERAEYSIERSDNGATLFVNRDAIVSYADTVQLNVDASGDIEYTIDYDGDLPDALNIEISDLPEGASAYYRFKGLPDGVVFQRADAESSRAGLEAADVTSWFRAGNGDYLVKVVADVYFPWNEARGDTDVSQQNIYNDRLKIIIADRENAEPSGNERPFFDPQDFLPEAAVPNALPERAESTSQTVDIRSDDARWSDASTWDGDVPGAGDIIVIEEGQRVVLDTNAEVQAILINGGELVVEDTQDLALAADWVLVINGGLFQVGTEENPFQHDFDLTLEGDDPDNDVHVNMILNSTSDNVIRVRDEADPVPPETSEEFAINLGSNRSVQTSDGTVFEADTTGVGNRYTNSRDDVAGTQADLLFQSHAWSTEGLSYDFDIADGQYTVELYFAEVYEPTSRTDGRVFDVSLEGEVIRDSLDVYAEVGDDAAFVVTKTVTVSDGSLTLDLENETQNSMLSGIKVTSTPAPTIALNIGSNSDFVSESGIVYAADTTGIGNRYQDTSVEIANTQDDGLFQSHAWSGNGLEYDFALENGVYAVELLFAEIFNPTSETGKRVFDIEIEGELSADNLDIFDSADEDAEFAFSQTVEVSDGNLDINLFNEIENPMLSGLAITRLDDTSHAAEVHMAADPLVSTHHMVEHHDMM